ncbi:T9SS type A sorting domain-containing protein [Winogradskyella poriferorum]|uniref:T9SS type A sorting domain-containing protein n=1 Tax=Winogradskyella poriferorum TaxID=307627 RepID=UPI003D6555FA
MKLKLLFFVFSIIQFVSFAQCPPDGIFNSQAEIDAFAVNFPTCESIETTLVISGSDISDLTPLSNISSVTGSSIIIENNPLLVSLDGLETIFSNNTTITAIRITDNPILSDFDALQNLTACNSLYLINNEQLTNLNDLNSLAFFGVQIISPIGTGDLIIQDNINLISLTGLSNINSPNIETIGIRNNPSLISLEGLEVFERVIVLDVQDNDNLLDLSGLNNITNVIDDLNVINNDGLTSLNGLGSLVQVGFLGIINNSILVSLDGIGEISFWSSISVVDNPSLTNISAIENFSENFNNELSLIGNTNLEICNYPFICNWLEDNSQFFNVQIENNANGCNSSIEVQAICSPCQPNLIFTSQAEIDAFATNYPDCIQVSGFLKINGADITNVDALSVLESAASLEVVDNPLLANLNGLGNLTSLMSGMVIKDNPMLESIDGLNNVTGFLSLPIEIRNNPALQSLSGLEGITGTEDICLIINNDSLTDLTGLNSFSSCDDLFVEDNDTLESISGLATSINTGRFYFINNDSALTLTSDSALNPRSGIVIQGNELLEDLNGLDGVYEFGSSVEIIITDNPSLSLCSNSYTCSFIPNLDLDWDTIEVRDNESGCNTVFEISSGCNQEPFNDECEGGELEELVIGQSYDVSVDLATTSFNVPTCNDLPNRADVWFTFNSETLMNIDIVIDQAYSIQLWEGDCNALFPVSNACGSSPLQNISLTQNTDYFIQVWNNNSGRNVSSTNFQITLQEATLSNSDLNFEAIKVFPNPVSNSLQVNGVDNADTTLKIFNALGQTIKSSKGNSIDMSELNSGVYFLNIISNTKNIIRRVIKE